MKISFKNIFGPFFPSKKVNFDNDFLDPINPNDYHIKNDIYTDLLKGLSDSPIIRLICLPGLTFYEKLISIEKVNDDYKLIYRRYAHKLSDEELELLNFSEQPKSFNKEKKVSQKIANAIQDLFLISLKQGKIKSISQRPSLGADGETYYFSTFKDDELLIGHKWSPDINTKTIELLRICYDLVEYIEDEFNESSLLERITLLENRFKDSIDESSKA